MPLAISALAGLLAGSFLNVVAYRLPRRESLVSPSSHCPSCEAPVRPWDNVPVLSWILLRGRCRNCGARISARYPLIEATTAALAVAVVALRWEDPDVWLGLALVAILVPAAVIDLEHRIIPNTLMAAGAIAAVAIGLLTDPSGEPERLIAGACAGAFLLAAALAYPRGMGMGDVKLAAVLGLFLGREVAVALLVALVAGTLAGLVVMARSGVADGRKTAIPFGPFLALGGIVALLAGEPIVQWYLDTFAR